MSHLWFDRALLPTGWASGVRLTIEHGRIVAIEQDVDLSQSDERHKVALPGLCNVHSHGFQRGMAGLSERRGRPDDDFWSWREVMYRFLHRLTPDDIAAITMQAYVEMLETGYTRVGEFHYLHNDIDGRPYGDPAETAGAVIAAATGTGIGLTLLPVFYAHADFGGAPPVAGQRRFVSDLEGFARIVDASRAKLSGDSNFGIAPHSLRAVTPDELGAIIPMAANGPIHIHAAEQQREVDACVGWSGARPVEWLMDNAQVDEHWCLIHATHLDDRECERFAVSGAVAGLCPVTEANLGDGIFPASNFIERGGRFATGTDSNILIDAASELRQLEYSQRLKHRRRAVLANDREPSVGLGLFTGAIAGGAQALGVQAGLSVGASADIVTLNMDDVSMAGADPATLIDRWIFAGRTGLVDTVWRAGRKWVEHGKHVHGEAIAMKYRETLLGLLG